MQDNIIILDVIKERSSDNHIAQMCNNLNNNYFTQSNAQDETPYTFGWGPNGGSSGTIKITVGAVSFLTIYDPEGVQVKVIGICGDPDLNEFSIANQVLTYQQGSFRFEAQFQLVDDTDIEITLEPGSNTSIQAFS